MTSSFLCSTYHKEKSYNGYKLDTCKSALQKYIRRNVLEKALYFAGELDLFKNSPERGQCIRTNFLHRLMIIYLEDIGIGNISLWKVIDDPMDKLLAHKSSPLEEEHLLTGIVTALCESPKARVCSHVRAISYVDPLAIQLAKVSYPTIYQWHMEVEKKDDSQFFTWCNEFKKDLIDHKWTALWWAQKIASDKKTKVKEYGRTKPVWKVFKLLENFVDPTIHKLAMKWYKELENLKENFLCWMILIVIHIQSIEIKSSITPSINVTKGTWDINRQFKKIELDDFVIDQHTYEGRSKGIGSATFVSIGALVIPESNYVIPEFKRFYEEFKSGAIQGASLESSYTFLVRAQLTTSASKSDVYFAKDPLGQLVVVKGPLKSIKEAEFMLDMQEWKKNHKIPYLNATCEWLVMDRWLQGVPLGLRNTLDRQKPHPFLIIKSEVPENAILNNKKLHQSNLWPPTEVVDWNKVPLHLNIDHLTPQEWNDYVTALLMRYVFGISDLADRNFLMVNGRVISIDEEINSRNVSFMVELKKTKCATIHEWLKLHYDELSLDWEIPEEALDKLTIIQKKEKCMALFK